ncbi:MAG: hypothetical protein AABX98_05250 [Nanoarchaeota archaeon]
MKRKLIKQGGYGLTFYVPKKWVDAKQLHAGDEIEVTPIEDTLLLSAASIKGQKKMLSLEIKKTRESGVRTLLVNAYRAGFDEIHVTYAGNKEEIEYIVSTFLLGFEILKQENKIYTLKSISEPSTENFEQIFQRQFYIVEEIIKNMHDKKIKELIHKVQVYDHFLKRCIARNISRQTKDFFLWQFLSHLTQIARLSYHCQKQATLSKEMNPLRNTLEQMFALLKTASLKKEYSLLTQLHTLDQEMLDKEKKLLKTKDAIAVHYLLMISRTIYLANSPLTGYLQLLQPSS